jgi:hypothetical protein
MLDARRLQGKFGEDYVRVLASAAGLLVYTYDLDADGIDLGFRFPGRVNHVASPAIEAQVKTWSKPSGQAGEWHFNGLNEVQFNKLAGDDYSVPRFLFLILVPSDARDYAALSTDGMLLRHLGYFVSLRAATPIEHPNNRRRRPVQVPKANVLTVATLRKLTDLSLVG